MASDPYSFSNKAAATIASAAFKDHGIITAEENAYVVD